MHIYITARHFDLTETISAHVQKHLVEAVQNHANPQEVTRMQVQLELGQRDAEFGCHVQLSLTGHRDINITEQSHDLYLAIDSAQKRLLTALSSHRETELKKVRHPRQFSAEKVAKILRGAQ